MADSPAVRHRRLLAAMRWWGLLTTSEAACAIALHRDGFGGPGHGPEAVWRLGGPTAVIRGAIKARRRWRRAFALEDPLAEPSRAL